MDVESETWKLCCDFVQVEMASLVESFVTPLAKLFEPKFGQALGTGSYLEIQGATYVITNEHVIREGSDARVVHLPGGNGRTFVALDESQIYSRPWPVDAALARVAALGDNAPRAAIPPQLFDASYHPVSGELLFFVGYPGSTAVRDEPVSDEALRLSHFGQIEMVGVPMVTQAYPGNLPVPQFDPAIHALIEYPTAARRPGADEPSALFNPKGMSGSLLWDTRFVASGADCNKWSADMARVCGLVWDAHPSRPGDLPAPKVLSAIKIEHVLTLVPELLKG